MKKQLIITLLVIGLSGAGLSQAIARGNYGGQGGPGCMQRDPAVVEKLDAFFQENAELRKQMAMKRTEYKAVMSADNPDPAVAAALAGELFDLRTDLRAKADEAGVAQYLPGPGGGGFGRGKGGEGGRGWENGTRGAGGWDDDVDRSRQGKGGGGGRW
ncbi:MAG TPA: hypothetical protein DDX99_07330 [Desulfofustis sp.]|jgi:zinc resistance-associated protein|nr:hypothetical protein [Desulfofustis sp. PB-SRB1]HBH28643.1 hypothetical protein [Desulfofustis sp.]